MTVQIRLFAMFRETAGADRLEAPADAADTVNELWAWLVARHPELDRHVPAAAVNAQWARMDARVADGDEVAFLPPVSGG